MLSCSMWFSAPSFWMGGDLERRCVGHVDGAHRVFGWVMVLRATAWVVFTVQMVPCTIRTVNMTHAVALKTITHPKTRCRKPYAATQHVMLLMMVVCTRNVLS